MANVKFVLISRETMKLTLCLLIVVLAAVLIMSYNNNKEPFEDIAIKAVIEAKPIPITPDTEATTNSANDTAAPAPMQSNMASLSDELPLIQTGPDMKINSLTVTDANALGLQNKAKLLKDVQETVHNEMILHRQTDPVQCNGSKSESASSKQGKEYQKDKPKAKPTPSDDNPCPAYPNGTCPSIPDMSKYIRKDEIPCWGCTLDY